MKSLSLTLLLSASLFAAADGGKTDKSSATSSASAACVSYLSTIQPTSPELEAYEINGRRLLESRQAVSHQRVRWLYTRLAQVLGLRDTYRAVEPEAPGYTINTRFPQLSYLRHDLNEQRLDYIFAGEQSDMVGLVVRRAHLAFTELLDGLYPSDHFMVTSEIEFFRR